MRSIVQFPDTCSECRGDPVGFEVPVAYAYNTTFDERLRQICTPRHLGRDLRPGGIRLLDGDLRDHRRCRDVRLLGRRCPLRRGAVQKGSPFRAVLSYIYADLIVPSIIDTYREYYGIYRAGFLYWLHRQDSGGQGCQKMPASAVN